MPNRLKNLDVQWISLVRNPANGLPLLLKDANAKPFRLVKTDAARRMVYGVVYAPDAVDSQGDFADRFEVERAAHAFLKGNRTARVDANHEFEPLAGAYVAESWIVRAADPEFADWVPDAWAVGIKIEDDALWETVKAGDYSGLSLAGTAEREPVEPPAEIPPDPPSPKGDGEAGVTVSKAEFDALVRAVEAIAASLDAPPPVGATGRSPLHPAEPEKGNDPGAEMKTRLEEIARSQTALADRLTAVEKQRLSAEFAPPSAPKNWLREVL